MRPRPFRLERFFAVHEFTARHLLCKSDLETMTLGNLLGSEADGALEALLNLRLGYTETQGDPALREEISSLYSATESDQVLVHAAGEEAIFVFMNAVLEPGDHVIVHQPSYQSLSEVARAIGCRVTSWTARHDQGWTPDLDALRDQIGPATRLLVINYPHNPTGYLPDEATFLEILELAERSGLLVFSDEMYRLTEHEPEDCLPAAADVMHGAVSLSGMSKAFGLPGLRLAWVATRNGPILEAMQGFKDYTTICNSAPSEFLTRIALTRRERIVAERRELMTQNLRRLTSFMDERTGLAEWVRPRAGPVAFPRFVDARDVDLFCDQLLHGESVLLLPGSLFSEDRHFRIGFGQRDFAAGLQRLADHLEAPASPPGQAGTR